jgi:hypothetical protein
MRELYSPDGEMELLLLRSVLDDAAIPYFVRNDVFGSLYPALYAEAYNRKTVCVPEAHFDEATALVREFLSRTGGPVPVKGSAPAGDEPHGPLGRLVHRALAWLESLGRGDDEEAKPVLRLIRNDRPLPAADDGSDDGDGDDGGGSPRRPPLRLVRTSRRGTGGGGRPARTPRG